MNRVRGVIDLGSNSVRLRIARRIAGGEFQNVVEEREMVRLGGSIVSTGSIHQKAIDESLAAIKRFKRLLQQHGIDNPLVFATAAIRDSANGNEVATDICKILGAPVRVLSTREEGELLLRGARRRYELDRAHGVIADLGGGSLQIIRTKRGFAVENTSLPLGALRMSERFGTGKYSAAAYARMSAWIRARLRSSIDTTIRGCDFLAGAGGGFASSESMAQAVGFRRKIPCSEVARQIRRLRDLAIEKRSLTPGLEAKRADIIVPSLCVIHELMKLIGAEHFVNYADGVRDGMLIEAFDGPESRCDTIIDAAFGLSARVPKVFKHAIQVRSLAKMIAVSLERLEPRRFSFAVQNLHILEAAALLHDVGTAIDYPEHHNWGSKIVSSEFLTPMSSHERAMISLLVRHHRRAPLDTRAARDGGFPPSTSRELVVLSHVLRAADALDRSHESRVREIQIGREPGGMGWIRIRGRGRLHAELKALHKKGGDLLSLIARDVRVEIR
jgi:exopolyphosphatase/guanosine-5'-triphosphate,3'-diphosphate pyrophosphatase